MDIRCSYCNKKIAEFVTEGDEKGFVEFICPRCKKKTQQSVRSIVIPKQFSHGVTKSNSLCEVKINGEDIEINVKTEEAPEVLLKAAGHGDSN